MGNEELKHQDLRTRTKQFAIRIVKMFGELPQSTEAQIMGKQSLRSGTSVAANYREASRARSDAEFISKMGIIEQELDETLLWLELLVETEIVREEKMSLLHQEAEELLKIVVTCIRNVKKKRPKREG